MKNKNLASLSLASSLAIFTCSPICAKGIFPAEIMGRDLLIYGLGWIGHVGIATTQMYSANGMNRFADKVIEVLNETPVGQINTINNFKSRAKYWGSKFGIVDNSERGYRVLLEANHQRWWCPKYTSDTRYHIGSGIPTTGHIIECGTWRCDTYAWWAFFSQGYNTMPGSIWLPRVMFNFFPFYNDERRIMPNSELTESIGAKKTLESVTAKELNNMPYEEFVQIMDSSDNLYVTSSSALQMQFASNNDLNDIKRGIMIDRLIADDVEPGLVRKLLNLYKETDNIEIKHKIIEGLMLYNQRHRNNKAYIENDKPELKKFFATHISSQSLTPKMADNVIRGFIDTHSSAEILANLNDINNRLLTVDSYASIMLKYTLVHKSKELQHIFIQSIVNELREQNNSDLDSYLFGPLSIGYKNTGKNLLEPESRQLVIDYLKEVRHKYTSKGIKDDQSDIHRITTAPYYFELIDNMGS